MAYVLVKDGSIVQYPVSIGNWRVENPSISLPAIPNEEQLNEQGIYTVYQTPMPYYNTVTQNCNEVYPVNVDGFWKQVWVTEDADAQEIAQREEEAKALNKSKAMLFLTETDWTQMPDVLLVNKDEFTAYRSQLRAIAINPPIEVQEWPVKPEEVWS